MKGIHKESLLGEFATIKRCYEDEFGISAYIVPKKEYEKAKNIKELQYYHSIYFLVGHAPVNIVSDGKNETIIKPTVYVGMTSDQPAYQRLYQHAKSETEWYRKYWDKATIFTNDTWESEIGDYRMKYLEEVFWLLMDKSQYLDCNGQEPHKQKRIDYDKDSIKYFVRTRKTL